jgi:putative tricarboxylic transport membrane protein
MLTSLMIVTYLVRGSMVRALIMVALGLVLGTLGNDPLTGTERFSYGVLVLRDGVGLIPLVIGMFGVAEILESVGASTKPEVFQKRIRGYLPTLQDWKDSGGPIVRGSLMGFFLGIFPGMSPMIPTFLSYGIEKRLSRHPERFGTGAIEGVAVAESCNNSASTSGFVPLFSLGIPSNAFNAVLLGALMIYGLQPGPLLIKTNPDLFWGVLASMYVGNVMLVVLNLPLIPLWVWVLRIPYTLLSIVILVFCFLGAYSINNSTAEVLMTFTFGIVGFLFRRFGFETPPLVLAFVLGPLIEKTFRQSLIMSGGSFAIFVTQPISAVFMLAALGVIITAFLKKKPFAEGVERED